MALIINGKELAKELESGLAQKVNELIVKTSQRPRLAVVLVGSDPASKIYVGLKTKRANLCGIEVADFCYPENISTSELKIELERIVKGQNGNQIPDGILIQLPLPKQIVVDEVLSVIPVELDVDGLVPLSQGLMLRGQTRFEPCTPLGILKLIDKANELLGNSILLRGKKAVVLGRSLIVGKPIGLMLLEKDCTVTFCHSKTQNLKEECRQADILIVAIGVANFITSEYVKTGAIVIDVGINRLADGRVVGDVDFEQVSQVAAALTPVPGGVGPMTIAMLLQNVVKSAIGRTVCGAIYK
ncbi:MAG: bifunctional 5,10-methylenetetrahydrofolate dehydrogenase/5,10-methenyltetrahydrofolate cyclohydrolase [Deltaproteobacteria bacterium]|jgi:methylenetetrahydrofolate dehydrogenase (NADP+)/methenyltetrahydrofolate cyclohydrolase|nr:bifunctional 5,10-methylenetetrahydrofolate dehydrogenase/5,10-methenyltetrahydrofolate cyclohydrolase [Deltaproteobacteria bacterium]